ncbi:uncharacterized protein METZ01_LOCUS142047, partial [marine metagenome]
MENKMGKAAKGTKTQEAKENFDAIAANNADRVKALDNTLGQIEKQFGQGAVMKMGDKGSMSMESIPTGALALDLALGIGGIPRGRIAEIFGPEGSGKTTLATHVVAEAQ